MDWEWDLIWVSVGMRPDMSVSLGMRLHMSASLGMRLNMSASLGMRLNMSESLGMYDTIKITWISNYAFPSHFCLTTYSSGDNYAHVQTVGIFLFAHQEPGYKAGLPHCTYQKIVNVSLIPRIRGCMGMRLICTLTCVNWHVCTHNDDIVTVYTQTPTVYMYMLVYTHKFQLYVCIYTNTRLT